jgi:hypothetical protein
VSEPEPKVRTLIHELKNNEAIAWIDAAVWPPIGTVVEVASTNRDAVVIGVRLAVSPEGTANVIVDVKDARIGPFTSDDPCGRTDSQDDVCDS